MVLSKVHIALVASVIALAGAWSLAPASAQIQTPSQARTQGIPCRVSFDETTHGGDWSTAQGSAVMTQIAPQADGSFVAIGYGQATVTYNSFHGCTVVGSPWTQSYMVTIDSEDGQTAKVDVSDMGGPHSVTLINCLANGDPQFDADAPGLPTVDVQLHEGATPFSQDLVGPHGLHAGDAGSVTLHYCTPENPTGR